MLRGSLPCGAAVALVTMLACAPRHQPAKLTIAAAADLQFALPEVARQFHAAHPEIDPQIVYGSSGNFYQQIRNQAPFDLFLSADMDYPRQLVQYGQALPDSVFLYGVGRLAVWVPAQSPLDPVAMQMHIFDDPSVKHIAVANPKHAPYGRAAVAALQSSGIFDHVAGKLVLGENIAQALQYVQSGAADVGLVSLSLVAAPGMRGKGRYWEVPLSSYPQIFQGGVILKRAQSPPAVAAFRAYLTGSAGRRILQQYGFSLPEK